MKAPSVAVAMPPTGPARTWEDQKLAAYDTLLEHQDPKIEILDKEPKWRSNEL
jgi:hypothetical protein